MSDEKIKNKATSHLSEDEKQQLYKNARAKEWYENIWQTVGKCVFCDLKDKYILHEENGVVLTINIYPYIDGQLMAIPRRHIKSTNELTASEWETMRKFGYIAKKMFKKIHSHKAMWTLVKTGIEAQGTVADHLHMHYIPFDKTDLNTWNYRELKYTALENIALYKENIKEFIKSSGRFETKYKNQQTFPINSDLILINNKDEVLFEERKIQYKLDPDIITLPGGHVSNFNNGLIKELIREVKEETNFDAKEDNIQLVDSKLSTITYKSPSKYLNSNIPKHESLLWNIYLYTKRIDRVNLIANDDCEELLWIPVDKVEKHQRISDATKQTLIPIIKDLKDGKLQLE